MAEIPMEFKMLLEEYAPRLAGVPVVIRWREPAIIGQESAAYKFGDNFIFDVSEDGTVTQVIVKILSLCIDLRISANFFVASGILLNSSSSLTGEEAWIKTLGDYPELFEKGRNLGKEFKAGIIGKIREIDSEEGDLRDILEGLVEIYGNFSKIRD